MELSGDADQYRTRRAATDFSISLMTDMEQAKLLTTALEESPSLDVDSHCDYFGSSYHDSTDRFLHEDGGADSANAASE